MRDFYICVVAVIFCTTAGLIGGYYNGKRAADHWYAEHSITFKGSTNGAAVVCEVPQPQDCVYYPETGITITSPVHAEKQISPTITSTGCGGVGAVISSVHYEPNDLIRFELVVGTAPSTRCVVNMPRRPRGYSCMVGADFSRWDFVQKEISVTPTSVTLQNFNYEGIPAAPESSSHWHVLCGPRHALQPIAATPIVRDRQ